MTVEAMSTLEIGVRIAAGIFLILVNAFLVAVEFGLTRARQYDKEEFVDSGSRGLEKAWEMTHELEVYLTSCQVGISATSIALGVIAEPALLVFFEPLFNGTVLASLGAASLASFGLINLVHLTHGEQTPTYLGVEKSKMVCKYGAIPLYWFTFFMRPLIMIGDRVAKATLAIFGIKMTSAWVETNEQTIQSRSELRGKLDTFFKDQDITEERKNEILAAVDADMITVRDRMVPISDVAALSTENTRDENQEVIESYPHSRYPLIGKGFDDPKGIVYMTELAQTMYTTESETDLQSIAAEPMTLSMEMSIDEAIDEFQEQSQEMAFVVDESESVVVGVITITDVLESIVGELKDPIDEQG